MARAGRDKLQREPAGEEGVGGGGGAGGGGVGRAAHHRHVGANVAIHCHADSGGKKTKYLLKLATD